MKIAHYAYDHVDNPRCGGGGAYHELMVHSLLAQRHQVQMYCGRFPGAVTQKKGALEYRFLGWGSNYLLSRVSFAVFATIHSWLVRADVIVVGYSVYAPVLSFLLRPRKTVLELYHLVGTVPLRKYGPAGLLPMGAEWLALSRGGWFLTLTAAMTDLIVRKRPGATSRVTNTGIAPDLAPHPHPQGDYILYFGRIDIHMKGLDILLDAFELCADAAQSRARLIIAGRGAQTDLNRIKERIARSPLHERIELQIGVSDEQKRSLLSNALFVCAPSRFEGWNIVVVEAAACGRAVLATQVTGFKESVSDGVTGVLVPPGDSAALAAGMRQLLENTPLRKKLGDAGPQWAARFKWETVAKVHEEVYTMVTYQRAKECR